MEYISPRLAGRIFGHNFVIEGYIKKATNKVQGITNLCEDGMFIMLLDYDEQDIDRIRFEMRAKQKRYDIGNIYILESSKNKYHAISFSKFEPSELRDISRGLTTDPGHRRNSVTNIRTSPKGKAPISLFEVMESPTGRISSNAHARYYSEQGIIPIEKYRGIVFDDSLTLPTTTYYT